MYTATKKTEKLLDYLRLEANEVDVSDIHEILNISIPTVYKLINPLIKDKCLKKTKTKISINPDYYTLIGISIGTTLCKVSFLDFAYNRFSTKKFSDHKTALYNKIHPIIETTGCKDDQIEKCINEKRHNYFFFHTPSDFNTLKEILDKITEYIISKNNEMHVLSIGLSCTGLINRKEKRIVESHNLKWMENCGINNLFYPDKLAYCKDNNIYISLIQNSHASVIAEKISLYKSDKDSIYHMHRNDKNIATIYVEYGSGMGLLINNNIYSGTSGYGGEIGHMSTTDYANSAEFSTLFSLYNLNKDVCTCGNTNCYDLMIRNYCFNNSSNFRGSSDNETNNQYLNISFADWSATDIKNFLSQHKKNANLLGQYIGDMINTVTSILDVDILILTGKIYKSEPELRNAIARAQDKSKLSYNRNDCTILFSYIGSSAPSIGAALYSYKEKYGLKCKWNTK